jgi:PEP-CTERM motif
VHRLAAAIALLLASSASGSVIPVDWNDGGTTGTLGGVTVTMTGLEGPGVFTTADFEDPFELTGPDYAGAPIPGVTELSSYDVLSDWTATFSEPVSNLLLYVVFWRGVAGQPEPPDTAVIYTFDQTFTVLSGLGDAVFPEGDKTFAAPEEVFHLGILQFAGPISSLSLTSSSFGHSAQGLTFGVVPEPSALLLCALALGFAVRARRRG